MSELIPILERVKSGDPVAVRACVDRYGALVWSLARRLSPSQADAEDAVQEIFFDLWKSAARFDARVASEATFVAMIARRRLIDRKRQRARRPDTDPMPEPHNLLEQVAHEDHGSRAELCAEASLAARAVAQLRPEQQQVLLATCQGLSHEEISGATGMPLGTVKAHARRGLIRVRAMLDAGATANAPEEGGGA